MWNLASLTVLIAEADTRLKSFSGGFRKSHAQFDSDDVVLFLTGLAFLIAVLWLVARWSERRVRRDSSFGLFWTLAKAHDVSWTDRWLLWRIARAKGLSEPAVIFLDPRITSPQFTNHLSPPAALRLKALRRIFFFGIDQEAEVANGSIAEDAAPSHPIPSAIQAPPNIAADQAFPIAATGNLADALSAIRALNLHEQLAQYRDPDEKVPEKQTKTPATPTAEFPSCDAPVLDLYPWLSNDWEITDDDE